MFDDHNNSGVPNNLPMEPEDMFAGTDRDDASSGQAAPSTPNALSAGLLKKKESSSNQISSGAVAGANFSANSMYEMKQPILGKILLSVFLLAVLGGLGFGGWYFYNKFNTSGSNSAMPVNNNTAEKTPVSPSIPTENTTSTNTNENTEDTISGGEVTTSMNNDKILFGESVDSDKDGLDDVREKQIGTDPNKSDTDADGLSDSDEVIIWKTNPLKADTDGDSYLDGSEVYHGYNPLGPGKLFNVPAGATSTSSSVSTSTSGTVK